MIEQCELIKVAQEGGHVAGTARKEIEQKTGESVISSKNAKKLKNLKKNLLQ